MDELIKQLEELEKKHKTLKRSLFKSIVNISQDKIIQKIKDRTKVKTGNLLSGQKVNVGTKGGYSVVKPEWSYAPHTYLIEYGHKVTRKGSIIGYAPGRHMYRDTILEIEQDLEKICRQVEQELVRVMI